MRFSETHSECVSEVVPPTRPPTEPTRLLQHLEDKVIQRGKSVLFECKVNHDPTLVPTTIWLRDNDELPDDER